MADTEMTVSEGRAFLGVSRDKMALLIKTGRISARRDPLDERRKLIKKSDLQKLKEKSKQ